MNNVGEPGATSLSTALKANSTLIHFDLGMSYFVHLFFCFQIHSMDNKVGVAGTSSLSGALKVNSSITLLDLRVNLFVLRFLFCYNHLYF